MQDHSAFHAALKHMQLHCRLRSRRRLNLLSRIPTEDWKSSRYMGDLMVGSAVGRPKKPHLCSLLRDYHLWTQSFNIRLLVLVRLRHYLDFLSFVFFCFCSFPALHMDSRSQIWQFEAVNIPDWKLSIRRAFSPMFAAADCPFSKERPYVSVAWIRLAPAVCSDSVHVNILHSAGIGCSGG